MCEALRKATRTVTRAYDDALRPVGLRITQFAVLGYLAQNGESRVRDMAAGLLLEETTLTRSLGPLVANGWVAARPGEDRRERLLSLTPAGGAVLGQAGPLWRSAQKRLREELSPSTWDSLLCLLPRVADTASES